MATANPPQGYGLLLQTFVVVFIIVTITFSVKLYHARQFFRRLRNQGLPMPPHHPIFGHILVTASILATLPKDAHGHYIADSMRRRFPDLGPIYYLDTWPFALPVLVVISPTLASQFTQERSLPKHEGMRHFLQPLTGEHDLVTMEGQMWKTWRSIFNPGFSSHHLMTLVPEMMEDVMIFRDILREHVAEADMFALEDAALNVTMDVIGRVALDVRFNTQRAYNDMTAALRNQIRWCTFGIEPNPLDRFNPFRPFVQWYNTRRMNRYIIPKLESRYARHRDTSKNKTIIDLALSSYLAENFGGQAAKGMDATFKEFATNQMKLFIFAGHDTTASTICYVYHLLSGHPSVMKRLREEHDTIFGPIIKDTPSLIASKPHLLHQLPYTLAIIKETLRLFPAVTSPRAGQPGFFLTDSQGRQFPTEKCLLWGNHHGLHHNPLYWPQADKFLPERWIAPADDPLHPVKNAWRPFEFGPRNCIGQELALLEMKMILALTIREFDVSTSYDEWDRLHGLTGSRNARKSVHGERAYQVQMGSAHPSDGMPCRVSLAKGQ